MALRLLLCSILLVLLSPLHAQQPVPLPERLEIEWILKYEQSYGIAGLYVDEPPAATDDPAALVREQLLLLTRAGREMQRATPGDKPTPALLYQRLLTESEVRPPEGVQFVWSDQTRRFITARGGAYDIVHGAALQLQAAETYRTRVAEGSFHVMRAWEALARVQAAPELLRREVETRRFAVRQTESGPIQAARRTQELLQELHDAIEMATSLDLLEPGQAITMQDVGRTGLIDLLEALPLGGKYQVTMVGEPPTARFGDAVVKLDPDDVKNRLVAQAQRELAARPEYPPAIAVAARYETPERALKMIATAIALWPDVPALRVQRLATNAQLANLEAMNEDLDYLLARFPAAPILLEIDVATRQGPLATVPEFRANIAETMANIRPEVLNVQLIAFKELWEAGERARAAAIRSRLIERHPGYEPLLIDPLNPPAESGQDPQPGPESITPIAGDPNNS